jgi:hAT family C-terminal dimerisation region
LLIDFCLACHPESVGKKILEFWSAHEPRYPILARIAKDFLAIPVSGVGVESLFSIGRDVCHYRRSRLSADTIEAAMIQLMSDRGAINREYEDILEEMEESYDDDYIGLDINENMPTYISDEEDKNEAQEDGNSDDGIDISDEDSHGGDERENEEEENEEEENEEEENEEDRLEDSEELINTEHSSESGQRIISAKSKGKQPARKSRRTVPESGYYHRLQNNK